MYATHFSQTNTHTQGTTLNQKIFRFVVILFAVLSVLYAYVIGNITFNVVARNSFSQEKSTITSRIGELEVEYLTLSAGITMDVARASGFEEASQIYYVKNNGSVSRSAFLSNDL